MAGEIVKVPSLDLRKFNMAETQLNTHKADLSKITEIVNEDQAKEATATLKLALTTVKEIEAKRKELVKPINEVKDKIQDRANALKKILPKDIDRVKALVVNFQVVQEEIERKAQEAEDNRKLEAQEKLDQAKEDAADSDGFLSEDQEKEQAEEINTLEGEATQSFNITSTKTKGITTTWKHEITDEALIPKEYMLIDEVAIRKAVKAGERNIPGVRIYEHKNLTVR